MTDAEEKTPRPQLVELAWRDRRKVLRPAVDENGRITVDLSLNSIANLVITLVIVQLVAGAIIGLFFGGALFGG